MSERLNSKQIKRIRPLHRYANEAKPQLSPNAGLLDDSPVRRYSSRRARPGDRLRAVIATAAIAIVIELP